MLELTIIFLGSVPTRGVSFKAPAGPHWARCMAKAIYALKIWMLRSQFQLIKREERGIWDVCIFTVHLYVKAWFTALSAISAPRNDLKLLKSTSINLWIHRQHWKNSLSICSTCRKNLWLLLFLIRMYLLKLRVEWFVIWKNQAKSIG